MVLKDMDRSLHGDTTSLTVRDRATGWLEGFPAATKSQESAVIALQQFLGNQTMKRFYGDCAAELYAACMQIGIRPDQASPDRHETNGVVERANRSLLEGTRTVIFESGLPHRY